MCETPKNLPPPHKNFIDMSHHSSKKFAHNLNPPSQVDVDDVDIGVIISNGIVINIALLFSNIITILKREWGGCKKSFSWKLGDCHRNDG